MSTYNSLACQLINGLENILNYYFFSFRIMGFDFLEMEFLRNGNTPATWSVEVEQLAQRVTLLEWRKGDQAQGRTEEKKPAELGTCQSVQCCCASMRYWV